MDKTTITLKGRLISRREEFVYEDSDLTSLVFETENMGYYKVDSLTGDSGGGRKVRGTVRVDLETVEVPVKLGKQYRIVLEEIVEPSTNLAPHES